MTAASSAARPPRLTRPDLDALPSYVPGRNPADLARELGMPEAIKLASNEVPYGPLPGVVDAVAEAAASAHRYPDMAVLALRDALADRLGVAADRIATGCGSVALAEHLVRATCLPGDELVYAWRSFEAYPIIAATSGATSVRVPNAPHHGHDLPAMAAAVTDRTRLLLVCNPNNPTGTSVRRADIDRLLDAVPDHVLVALDEAYREFVTDPEVPDGLAVYGDRPNVVVLRTLSKAWGLAGLRIGYLVAQPDIAATVRKVVTPFSASSAAQAAALAALKQDDEVRRRCALVIAERDRVGEALRKHLPEVPDSQANFVWLPLGDRAVEFAKACEARGVIVRPFAGDGVRVTIGTPAENDAFLAAAEPALG
jgi:histidinol-phosphate aminotransferase